MIFFGKNNNPLKTLRTSYPAFFKNAMIISIKKIFGEMKYFDNNITIKPEGLLLF